MAQALFANQRETNLASTVALIEEVLAELGYPPPEPRTIAPRSRVADPEGLGDHADLARRPRRVHAPARVRGRDDARRQGRPRRAVRAPARAQRLAVRHRVRARGDRVLLVGERSTLDLDRSEVLDLIRRVTTNADDHDDVLVARFGGTLGE